MSKISDERLAEMLLVIGDPIEQLSISLPSTNLHFALTKLQSLRSQAWVSEAVAQMIGPWDMEGDCIVWLDGCEVLSAGDYLYAHPALTAALELDKQPISGHIQPNDGQTP